MRFFTNKKNQKRIVAIIAAILVFIMVACLLSALR